VRFIGDGSIQEKDFGHIQIDRIKEMKKVARNFNKDEGNLSNVKFSIVPANDHYAGFDPGTVNIFRHLLLGVAASPGKPIMVFEDYDDNIKYPIPYLNHYVRDRQTEEHSRYIGSILGHNMPFQRLRSPDHIRCPYPNCNTEYSYWSHRRKMTPCPACRQIFTFDGNSIIKSGN
jgi:hypothetical protein